MVLWSSQAHWPLCAPKRLLNVPVFPIEFLSDLPFPGNELIIVCGKRLMAEFDWDNIIHHVLAFLLKIWESTLFENTKSMMESKETTTNKGIIILVKFPQGISWQRVLKRFEISQSHNGS